MKKKLYIAMALVLVALVVAASAQEVLSANAVGYIKKTLPANAKLIAVSIPLNNMNEADNVFGRTSIAQEAPTGSWVYFWDEVQQGWSGTQKAGAPKFWPGGTSNRVVRPGEAFFMKGPAGGADAVVTITGEVPDDAQLSRLMPGSGALAAIANPYPVDFKFGESALAINATPGSWVYFWDEVQQGWSGTQKAGAPKFWPGGTSNRVVLAAEGFFMKEEGTVTSWDQNKPYTWP